MMQEDLLTSNEVVNDHSNQNFPKILHDKTKYYQSTRGVFQRGPAAMAYFPELYYNGIVFCLCEEDLVRCKGSVQFNGLS